MKTKQNLFILGLILFVFLASSQPVKAALESFDDEAVGNTTFSNAGINFSATGDLEIEPFGSVGPNNLGTTATFIPPHTPTPNSAGEIQITTPSTGFQVVSLHAWTSNNGSA